MPVTLTSLIALVDAELENYAMRGSAEVTGDGETAAFLIAPLGCQIISDDTWGVYIDGAATAAYTMDYDSGVCTMTGVPTTAQTVSWQFSYKHWPTDLVTSAINAALDNLFPAFYVRSSETITADGETYEYEVEAAEYVVGVDSRDSATSPWGGLKRKRYETIYDTGVPSLRFYAAPQSGQIRVHYIARPAALASASDDLETDSGLPSRAAAPIVSYACYYLLAQKMAPRVRSDVGVVTQGQGVLMPSQMNYGSQGFLMRYQFQLASMRMSPWSLR